MSFRAEFHCDVRPGAERGSPPLDGQFAWCPGPARESIAKTCGKAGALQASTERGGGAEHDDVHIVSKSRYARVSKPWKSVNAQGVKRVDINK